MRAEKDPKLRWDLARRLPTLPRTPESVAAFREAIEALLPARLAEKGELERPTLSDTAEFHDPELVPWLLSQVRQARGVREQREAFQRDVLRAVVELGTKAQLPLLRDALLHYGDAETRVRFGRIEALLEACRTDALCYVEALTDPWHQAEDASHVATKAGRMAVVFGDATTRLELIERFPRIYGDSARLAAARAVLSLTLDGGAAVTPRIRRFLAEESRADGESESDALSWSQILEDLLVQLENRVLG